MEDNDNVQAILDVGASQASPITVQDFEGNNRKAVYVVPNGYQLKEIDLEPLRATPFRKKGTQALGTVEAFIAYTNMHRNPATSIYANKAGMTFTAVLNDHAPNVQATSGNEGAEGGPFAMGDAGWQDFKATYACPKSKEWLAWTGNDAQPKTQVQFAEFIEKYLLDIKSPPGATMLEVSRNLEAKKDVRFKSGIRLADGSQQFNYEEQVDGSVGGTNGQVKIPELFTITIPVFDGGGLYEIDARLRYRIEAGHLKLWYELVRPDKTADHAFGQVVEKVASGIIPNVPLYAI